MSGFVLPDELVAETPIEFHGQPRDQVRMLVDDGLSLTHRRVADLPAVLAPGDLLVVNTSATLPSAVTGRRGDGRPALLHVSGEIDGHWIIEVRRGAALAGPVDDVAVGEVLTLPEAITLTVASSYPYPGLAESRLWRAATTASRHAVLSAHGRPITYGRRRWPLPSYQTVFAAEPGSAEMPSAGRPFTADLVTRLVSRGIGIAPLTLHCGVSSPETHEPPVPEFFAVPASTARWVNATRAAGGRVIAVGTTVIRALESTCSASGALSAGGGWTEHVVGPSTPVRTVDGLLTGMHEPGASHLRMLHALAGPARVAATYAEALAAGYLWHEFGDTTLFLSDPVPNVVASDGPEPPGRR